MQKLLSILQNQRSQTHIIQNSSNNTTRIKAYSTTTAKHMKLYVSQAMFGNIDFAPDWLEKQHVGCDWSEYIEWRVSICLYSPLSANRNPNQAHIKHISNQLKSNCSWDCCIMNVSSYCSTNRFAYSLLKWNTVCVAK